MGILNNPRTTQEIETRTVLANAQSLGNQVMENLIGTDLSRGAINLDEYLATAISIELDQAEASNAAV